MKRKSCLTDQELSQVLNRFSCFGGDRKATRRAMLDMLRADGLELTGRQLRHAVEELLDLGHPITTLIGHGLAATPEEAAREEAAIRAPALTMLERAKRFRENCVRSHEAKVHANVGEKGQTTMAWGEATLPPGNQAYQLS